MLGWKKQEMESKISQRNINNHSYADDTTLMEEREEELKLLLMKVKEESEKADLKLNIPKSNIMASGPFIPWQINWEMRMSRMYIVSLLIYFYVEYIM